MMINDDDMMIMILAWKPKNALLFNYLRIIANLLSIDGPDCIQVLMSLASVSAFRL